MKKFLIALNIVIWSVVCFEVAHAAETKQVCKDVLDKKGAVVKNKDGSAKQTCKTIKVHKKFEGTKVPEPAKKK